MKEKVQLPLLKRLFDICISLVFMAIALPFVVLIVTFMFIEWLFDKSARGSVLYCEPRITQGREFQFCKFRIFRQAAIDAAAQKGCVHTAHLQENPRNITKSGNVLKTLYMDELPQLWHVFRGDMTLVGPRPTNLENCKNYKKKGDYTKELMICGLTGPYQAMKGREAEQQEMDEAYIEYVRNHNGVQVVIKDIGILFRTLRVIIEAKGL